MLLLLFISGFKVKLKGSKVKDFASKETKFEESYYYPIKTLNNHILWHGNHARRAIEKPSRKMQNSNGVSIDIKWNCIRLKDSKMSFSPSAT